MVGVQVTQADSVCVKEPDVFLQRAEGPVAELNDEPETFRLKQVTGGGTVRPGKTPRAAHHRKAHTVHTNESYSMHVQVHSAIHTAESI